MAEPTSPADFFQVGTAYRSEAGVFQCHAVSHHPQTGERRALGWMFRQVDGVHQWVVTQLDPDDFAGGGWTQTQCPEALYFPETGDLRRCIRSPHGLGGWHQTEGGIEWRDATEPEEATE